MILEINGSKSLCGTIKLPGAKNSSIACLIGALLSETKVELINVPKISDIDNVIEIMELLNVGIEVLDNKCIINAKEMIYEDLLYENVEHLRASYYFMGVFLALYSKVKIKYPGGCSFDVRPINYHLDGFTAFGYQVIEEKDYIEIIQDRQIEGVYCLPYKSVGATINLMFSIATSNKQCIIENASLEPEVKDVLRLLNEMGYFFEVINGNIVHNGYVINRHPVKHQVMPDRMVCMSYIFLGLAKGCIKIEGINYEDIKEIIEMLIDNHANIEIKGDTLITNISKLSNFNIISAPYPFFPTDLIQVIAPLLTKTDSSYLEDTVYENRISTLLDLKNFKGDIEMYGRKVIIRRSSLKGTKVKAKDLRHAFMLTFAGIIASGTTFISDIDYVFRGYENFIDNLKSLGCDVKLHKN